MSISSTINHYIMTVTMSNASHELEQICPRCGTLFIATNAKQKYCSGTCRTANHRAGKTEKLIEQDKVAQQKEAELKELKAAPVSCIQSVREVNPVWQQANHEYQAQQTHCRDLMQQLASLKQAMNGLTNSGRGALIGASTGMAIGLIWMAVRYDARQRKPLGVTYAVTALVLLVTYGLIGYWMGQQIEQEVRKIDKQAINKLNELRTSYSNLDEQLSVEKAHLEELRIALSKVPNIERETVTSVDEVRAPVTNPL